MWTDVYVKAADKAAFEAVCPWMGEDGLPVTEGPDFSMKVVGPLVYGGVWDAEGNVVTAPTVVAGWHVNLRLRDGVEVPPALLAFVIAAPAYPKVVFA